MALPAVEQINFVEAIAIGLTRQEARNRLIATYRSLLAKLVDGSKSAIVVLASGQVYPAKQALFFSEHVWSYFTTGEAPVDPSRPEETGQLFVCATEQEKKDQVLQFLPTDETKAKQLPHRPIGTSMGKADAPYLEKMRPLVEAGRSPHAAAKEVVGDGSAVPGAGTPDSKIRRLTQGYKNYTARRITENNGESVFLPRRPLLSLNISPLSFINGEQQDNDRLHSRRLRRRAAVRG
jgi:hypothetical protein